MYKTIMLVLLGWAAALTGVYLVLMANGSFAGGSGIFVLSILTLTMTICAREAVRGGRR